MTKSTRLYANNARTTLAAGIGPSDTSFTVADGSMFPTPNTGAGEYFVATLESGSTIEIVYVAARSGNVCSSITRAQDGTTASSFSLGSKFENRVNRDTLTAFTRKQDRMDDLASTTLLADPTTMDGNSYILQEVDDGGNRIVAMSSSGVWRFLTHSSRVVSGSITSSSTTSITSSSIGLSGSNVDATFPAGRFLMQITSGAKIGSVRNLSSMSTNTVNWGTALSGFSNGDSFAIYRSDYSFIQLLMTRSNDALTYSLLMNE